MNRNYIIQALNHQKFDTGLIIDDNKVWNHDSRFTRVGEYIDGDLHDFFDKVNDEVLFKDINERFDLIFIGEVFHVINLQTIIYNLEYARDCLTEDGIVSIAINEDSQTTNMTTYRKMVTRLEQLEGYKTTEKLTYVDEHAKEWTLLNLQKVATKQVAPDQLEDAIVIGGEIAKLLNSGKSITKLKTGFLQSNSQLDSKQFKAVFTTTNEMLGLYLQNAITDLKPSFNQEYAYTLADFIFVNRKAISSYDLIPNLQQGNFVLALEDYKACAVVQNPKFIASYAHVFELIWNRCLKQKINTQLKLEIDSLKE